MYLVALSSPILVTNYCVSLRNQNANNRHLLGDHRLMPKNRIAGLQLVAIEAPYVGSAGEALLFEASFSEKFDVARDACFRVDALDLRANSIDRYATVSRNLSRSLSFQESERHFAFSRC